MIHVIPNCDLRKHRLDTTCDCEPAVEFEREILVTHNSFDGREAREPDPNFKWIVLESEDSVLTGILAADGDMVPVEDDECDT